MRTNRIAQKTETLILLGAAVALCAFGPKRSQDPVTAPPAAAHASSSGDALQARDEAALKRWCTDLDESVKKLGWNIPPCDWKRWRLGGESVQGRPLVYAEFGNPQARSSNTSLVLAMVHPDEITPLYLALQLAQWMGDHPKDLTDAHVIIAPLVNPDGFYRPVRTRTNAHGVDLNRNFGTDDWSHEALQRWRRMFGANPRRFPGRQPNSEPETRFQLKLLEEMQPRKVLSVHSPLNFLDYDGPMTITLKRFPTEYVHRCLELRSRLQANHEGFFPGSLGNYAGQERGIPTFTLELPTANAGSARAYWERFSQGIRTMIQFEVPAYVFREPGSGDSSTLN